MTSSVAPNTALASPAVTAAAGNPAGATGINPVADAALEAQRAQAAAGPAAFPALLLGLCAAGAATPPAVNEPTAVTTATDELPTDATATEPEFTLPGLGGIPELSLPTGTAGGKPPSDPLPASGKDLPPPDVNTLLASLGLPTNAADNAIVGGPTPPATIVQPDAADLPPSANAGQDPATSGAQAPAQGSAASLTLPQLRDTARAAIDGSTTVAARQDDSTDPAESADSPADPPDIPDNALRDLPVASTAHRGIELALTADFRARLDTLLATAQRPVPPPDTGTISLSGFAATAGTASPGSVTPPGSTPGSPFASLPAMQPLSDSNAWSQGLGERLLLMADKGLQSATIKLHPEQLGPMQIRIQVDEDGTAQVMFSAHHAQTRDALEGAIPRLRDMFTEQGLSLMQANVDSGRSTFAQRDFASSLATWRNWDGDEPDPAAATRHATAWRGSRGSEHRVDVFV